ncbi:hypothetical protein E2P81_ATG00459 [Venturia nashicola]|nr:hypothetical protein E2P81_ATG00459 [Venturia nashicola]
MIERNTLAIEAVNMREAGNKEVDKEVDKKMDKEVDKKMDKETYRSGQQVRIAGLRGHIEAVFAALVDAVTFSRLDPSEPRWTYSFWPRSWNFEAWWVGSKVGSGKSECNTSTPSTSSFRLAITDVTGERAPAIVRRPRHVEALGIKTVFEVFDRFTDGGKGQSPPRFAD